MRNVLLLMTLTFYVYSFGQGYAATENGLRNSLDSSQTYIVITFDNKTSSELYFKTKEYINKTFKNPESVIKGDVINDYIRIKVYSQKFMRFKAFVSEYLSADFYIEYSFKDNKVKFEFIEMSIRPEKGIDFQFKRPKNSLKWSWYYLYNHKGELKNEKEKLEMESHFNHFLNDYIQFINKKDCLSLSVKLIYNIFKRHRWCLYSLLYQPIKQFPSIS